MNKLVTSIIGYTLHTHTHTHTMSNYIDRMLYGWVCMSKSLVYIKSVLREVSLYNLDTRYHVATLLVAEDFDTNSLQQRKHSHSLHDCHTL